MFKSSTLRLPQNASHWDIVRHYVQCRSEDFHRELSWYAEQPTFATALEEAAHARDRNGKRLPHQRRLLRHVIPNTVPLLRSRSDHLARSRSFDDLYTAIDKIMSNVEGARDLYRYDTALRLGAFLRIYPTRVFLQAGSLAGARNLSPSIRGRSVSLSDFPEAFHSLAPFEMENLLCCYRKVLRP